MYNSLIIVDDEKEVREGLATFIPWDYLGFRVVELFDNGSDALDYICFNDVKAAIVDVRMPKMSGLELVENLQYIRKKVYVVFLSAYGDYQYIRQSFLCGAEDYLLKPTKIDEVIKVFKKIGDQLKTGNHPQKSIELFSHIKESKMSYVFHNIHDYVNLNLRTVTLEAVAEKTGYTTYHFSKIFHKKVGMSFKNYLTLVRMERAKELIKSTDYRTKQIAEILGYTESSNFARAFKKYCGVSPTEYSNFSLTENSDAS